MTPFNTILYNENIKRQIFLKRHRNSFARRVEQELRNHDLEFASRFESAFLRLSQNDLKKLKQATVFTTDRLKDFKSVILSLQKSSEVRLTQIIDSELDQLSIDEFSFQLELVKKARKETKQKLPFLKSATKTKIKKYRGLEPLVDTTQYDQILHWSRGRSRKLLQTVRRELKLGKNSHDVLKSVYGTEKRFSGILKATHQGAKLIANTLHVSATSAANFAFVIINNNFDLLVSSILDSGSSKICMSNHNRFVFKDLEGNRSPYHFNCNTRVFPYLKGDSAPERESVLSWWKRQDDEVKIKFLGKKRFEAQKESNSSIDDPRDFISNEGKLFTLDELKAQGMIN